jgi:hypothetical protein
MQYAEGHTACMTNVQVRDVPDDVLAALRTEARDAGRSLQQHLLAVLAEHTARTRRQTLFAQLDAVLGDEPVLTVDAAQAVRAERDVLDERDARRAADR